MQHCDPDDLALVALGERVLDAADERHLATCVDCQAQIARLTPVVSVARAGSVDLLRPPDSVWTGVSESIHAPNQPADLGQRRSSWLKALAVAAAIVAVLGSFALGRLLPRGSLGSTVATAQLVRLPDSPAGVESGKAVVRQSGDRVTVSVDAVGLGGSSGFYEVWLMSPDDSKLVSLGTMSSGQTHADFEVPAGVPLDKYSNVDISDEPLDGDPTHSAVSVLRGQFDAAA